jgi:hypothetical protein
MRTMYPAVLANLHVQGMMSAFVFDGALGTPPIDELNSPHFKWDKFPSSGNNGEE